MSAPITVVAPLEPAQDGFLRQSRARLSSKIEAFLEAERGQLPLWFVASVGSGIAMWFALPGRAAWLGVAAVAGGLLAAGMLAPATRGGRALAWLGIGIVLGLALAWSRSILIAAPPLDQPRVVTFEAKVERVETLAARNSVRLTLSPRGEALPSRVRVSIDSEQAPDGLARGAEVKLRARLTPPPPMALPGTHDFARDAWFMGIGAVGRALGPLDLVQAAEGRGMDSVRSRLDTHVRSRLPGASGSIATALATGDQHAVSDADADAMRRSGLTHLLSVSGLHIAAVVGAAMLLSLRLLALSERLALRFNLVLVAAAAGAVTGIGYTWLTGLQVPTVRSCIAALLVLGGIALGRDAISLRLVAVGALAVMLFRPEAVAGASFQLSFAAVTAIIAFHGLPRVRALLHPRDEPAPARLGRILLSLILTGLVVEVALMPLALYHFHKSGLLGVAANLFAIPWTTFVIMPLEAVALALDSIGFGAPLWAATGWAIDLLLAVAHAVGDRPGAVTAIPAMPRAAFALMIGGGLWLCLWEGRARRWGVLPGIAGAVWASLTPAPDLMVTGDGRHLALVRADGVPVLLRERTGDYMRGLIGEAAGFDGETSDLPSQAFARCSPDSCVTAVERDGRRWVILATRSRNFLKWDEFTAACRAADVVVSDRRLPRGCAPRWLRLDPPALEQTGGLSIRLSWPPQVDSVAERTRGHPWAIAQ